MHDPLAVAVAEDPSLVEMEAFRGEIELVGEWTRGQLIPERRPIEGLESNVRVCTDVDVDKFINRFCEALIAV